jgi:hypothetical protein
LYNVAEFSTFHRRDFIDLICNAMSIPFEDGKRQRKTAADLRLPSPFWQSLA